VTTPGTDLGGRAVRVDFAKERKNDGKGGGKGGGKGKVRAAAGFPSLRAVQLIVGRVRAVKLGSKLLQTVSLAVRLERSSGL
jgi:hypothetical protein